MLWQRFVFCVWPFPLQLFEGPKTTTTHFGSRVRYKGRSAPPVQVRSPDDRFSAQHKIPVEKFHPPIPANAILNTCCTKKRQNMPVGLGCPPGSVQTSPWQWLLMLWAVAKTASIHLHEGGGVVGQPQIGKHRWACIWPFLANIITLALLAVFSRIPAKFVSWILVQLKGEIGPWFLAQ